VYSVCVALPYNADVADDEPISVLLRGGVHGDVTSILSRIAPHRAVYIELYGVAIVYISGSQSGVTPRDP